MRGISMHRTLKIAAAALLSAAVLLSGPARAQTQQDSVAQFYKGKTIRLIVGAAAGAAYDFMARVLAAHLWQIHSGQPYFRRREHARRRLHRDAQLSCRARAAGRHSDRPFARRRHSRAATQCAIARRKECAIRRDEVRLARLAGTATADLRRLASNAVQTFADIQKQEATFATTSRSGDNFVIPVFTNQALGTKLKLVQGYKGVNDIFHAMEQGEVQGTGMILASLLAKQDWIRDRKARVLMQFGATRNRLIPDVPTAIEVLQDEKAKQMLRIFAQKYATTYPFMLPSRRSA